MPNNSPTIGICLPNRNYSEYLADCLKSIQSQTYTNYVVYFCDGNSTDNSLQVFNQLSSGDDRFHVFSTSDKGQADAIHKAFSQLQRIVDILYYINSDDILVDRECFQKVVNYFYRLPSVNLLTFSGFYLKNGTLSEINYNYSPFSGLNYIRRRPAFLQPSTFITSAVYNQITIDTSYKWMFDSSFFYDVANHFNSAFFPERFSGHRLHSLNLTDVSNPKRTLEVARFYRSRYPLRPFLYYYLVSVSRLQLLLTSLPSKISVPLLKLLYLFVNTLSFLTAYLMPSI